MILPYNKLLNKAASSNNNKNKITKFNQTVLQKNMNKQQDLYKPISEIKSQNSEL